MPKKTKKTVEAEEFILTDGKGRVRGRFGVTRKGPRLEMLDTKGHIRLGVEINGIEPTLRLYDDSGAVRYWLALESGDQPYAMFYGPQLKYKLGLGVRADEPTLVLYGPNSIPVVEISAGETGNGLHITDTSLERSVSLGVQEEYPALTVLHTKGGLAEVSIDEEGPNIRLDNADSEPLWQVPRED